MIFPAFSGRRKAASPLRRASQTPFRAAFFTDLTLFLADAAR